jgi:hypothetical protein
MKKMVDQNLPIILFCYQGFDTHGIMREECHASFKDREKEIILRGPKNQTDFIKLCSAFFGVVDLT